MKSKEQVLMELKDIKDLWVDSIGTRHPYPKETARKDIAMAVKGSDFEDWDDEYFESPELKEIDVSFFGTLQGLIEGIKNSSLG